MNTLDTAKTKMQHGINLGGRTVELNGVETAQVYLALETLSTLAVAAEHWKETAERYGRLLQAVVAKEGGTLELEQADILNDTTMILVETEDDTITVTLTEVPGGG